MHRLPFPGPHAQVLTDLKPRVVDLGSDGPRPGDAVLVLLRTRAFPPGQTVTWQFAPDPREARTARARLRGKLGAWNIDEDTTQATELDWRRGPRRQSRRAALAPPRDTR